MQDSPFRVEMGNSATHPDLGFPKMLLNGLQRGSNAP